MPTNNELKALLRPLLERRPDLGFAQRTLFFTPLTHYLRGVVFVANSLSRTTDVVSFACPLYDGSSHVNFHTGRDQYEFRVGQDWKTDIERISRELCDKIEQDSLPPVEMIVDFERHLEAPIYLPGAYEQERQDSPHYAFVAALASCASGAYDSAEKLLEHVKNVHEDDSRGPLAEEFRFGSFTQRRVYLLHLLRTDRSQILPLLRDWEAFKVKSCKMTKYWKPSPFPCEL